MRTGHLYTNLEEDGLAEAAVRGAAGAFAIGEDSGEREGLIRYFVDKEGVYGYGVSDCTAMNSTRGF